MPVVGMETVPYVAAAGLCVAVAWWWSGSEERNTARHFGLAFAAVALAALVATVAPSRWFAVAVRRLLGRPGGRGAAGRARDWRGRCRCMPAAAAAPGAR